MWHSDVHSTDWLNEEEKRFVDTGRPDYTPKFETHVHPNPVSKVERAAIDVAMRGGRYVHLDYECKRNVYVCISAISNKPSMYLKMPDVIKANKHVAFEAIKRQGSLFGELPVDMRETRAFLYQAIRTHPEAIRDVSHEFQESNVDLVSGALRTGDAEYLVKNVRENAISKKALQHPDVIRHHVELHNPDSKDWKSYLLLPKDVQCNVNVMMKLFDQRESDQDSIFDHVMEAIPAEAKENVDTMLAVVRCHGVAYCKLAPHMQSRREFIEAAIRSNYNTSPMWYMRILSAVPWDSWHRTHDPAFCMQRDENEYDMAKNEPFFKTIAAKINSFTRVTSPITLPNLGGLSDEARDYLLKSSKDVAIALELYSPNSDMFGNEAAKTWFSDHFFELYLSQSIRNNSLGPSRNALTAMYNHQGAAQCYMSVPFAKQIIDVILQVRNFDVQRHRSYFSAQQELLNAVKVQHVDVDGNPLRITTGVATFPDELIEYVLCYVWNSDILGFLPKERIADPKFAIAALLKTPKRSKLNQSGIGSYFSLSNLFQSAPSTPSSDPVTIDGWVYREVCVCAKDETDPPGLTFAYKFNNEDDEHSIAHVAPLPPCFAPSRGRYVTIRYKHQSGSSVNNVEYIGPFPLKCVILLKSWLADERVVELLTTNSNHVSGVHMVVVYNMFTDEMKSDTKIACNMIKHWAPRDGTCLINAMTFATLKQINTGTTTTSTAANEQPAQNSPPAYYHIFKEAAVEQALLLFRGTLVIECTNEHELDMIVAGSGNPRAYEQYRTVNVSNSMDDAFLNFSQTPWYYNLTTDPIVAGLLLVAYFNQAVYSKEGKIRSPITFLKNFEYDLKTFTYGDAERRRKGLKIQTKALPASYYPVLIDTEEKGMWSRFVSGDMTDDEFDAVVGRMVGWCDALVEITKPSGYNNSSINLAATNVHQFLTRVSGPVAVRLDAREFEAAMELDEEDTAEIRRTLAFAEIEQDATSVAEKDDVITSAALTGKRKRTHEELACDEEEDDEEDE